MATALWTIGYEGRALHDVVKSLFDADVELLVDVRLRPQSRKPGLSKTPLGAALRETSIDYEHRRGLGTPVDIRGIYRAGDTVTAAAAFREHLLREAQADLDWLADVVTCRRAALLCFELDPRHCHRRVVAQELQRRLPELVIVDL